MVGCKNGRIIIVLSFKMNIFILNDSTIIISRTTNEFKNVSISCLFILSCSAFMLIKSIIQFFPISAGRNVDSGWSKNIRYGEKNYAKTSYQ